MPPSKSYLDPETSPASDSEFSDVLIVTDSPVNRVVLAGTLSRLGLRSLFVDFSFAGFGMEQTRAIIVDCTGKADGCAQIFARLDHANRPKVMMITDAGMLRDLPADVFVDKPMTFDKLEAAIRKLIAV